VGGFSSTGLITLLLPVLAPTLGFGLATGKVLGAMESPGLGLTVKESTSEIFIGSLTGNALR
jgi:hypothetical protein